MKPLHRVLREAHSFAIGVSGVAVDPRDFGKPQIYEMRKERETTIGSSAQVVLEIIVIAKPGLVQNRNTYKQQISKN